MSVANISLLYAICAFPLGLALLVAGIVTGRRGRLNLWSGGLALFGALIADTAVFSFIYWYMLRVGTPQIAMLITAGIIALNGLIFLIIFGFILIRRGN